MTVLAIVGVLALVFLFTAVVFVVGMSYGIAYSIRHSDKVLPNYNATLQTSALLISGRIGHVRKMCESSMEFDAMEPGGLSNRAWLAHSIINILDGSIDQQIMEELKG